MSEQYRYFIDYGRKYFIDGSYEKAEKFLGKAMQINNREPEIYQMLATIYYDRGKFKKAIQTFKRALEIDPDYTDASVGLSIVLNDIGRYSEGQEVFDTARSRLDQRQQPKDSQLYERLAQKHSELGQIYFTNKMYEEAAEQFQTAKKFKDSNDLTLLLANTWHLSGDLPRAQHLLQMTLRQNPDFVPGRILFGKLLYESNRVAEAVGQWENVLLRDPTNNEVRSLIKRAQAVDVTDE